MSIRIMSQVWDLQTESLTQKLVLLALADNANDAGVCWPSISCLAKKTQMSEQSVRNQIRAITAKGWMYSKARFDEAGDRASNLYQLNVPETAKCRLAGGQQSLPQVVNAVEDGGQRPAPGVVNHVHPEPSVEPSLTHQGGAPPVLKAGKKKKFPSEAFRSLELVRQKLQWLKDFGDREDGKLVGQHLEDYRYWKKLEKENERIACEV